MNRARNGGRVQELSKLTEGSTTKLKINDYPLLYKSFLKMTEKKKNILKEKTYEFAKKVVLVYKQIIAEHKEYVLSKQFLKSGTAPGALVNEAEFAQSKPDFISKLSIALKEGNECLFWTSLLKDAEYISEETFLDLQKDNKEITYILISSINTTKKNLK
jgi:four helix bundle protein